MNPAAQQPAITNLFRFDELATAAPEDAGQRIAVAQVHATLALAAATAMASRLVETEDGDEIAAMDPTDQEHWDKAAG